MKQAILIILILLLPVVLNAQVFINERFGSFPPTGWTRDSHPSNWITSDSRNAGGAAPEAAFRWEPAFSGMTRLVSPRINLTGFTSLKLQFKHFLDYYQTGFTVGVATRHGSDSWHVVWSTNPTGNIGPEVLSFDIANADVGQDSFQVCWYFSGVSTKIDNWYLDDILLFSPVNHDVGVTSISVENHYTSVDPIFLEAEIENSGLNPETFDVNCVVKYGQTVVFNNTQTGISLNAGAATNIEFPSFVASATNQLYDVIICTQLSGDLNTSNDSASGSFNTYSIPRDMVVLEIGTGTWCSACPGAAMGAEDLIEHGHNVAIIEYHAGGGGDPFINSYGTSRCNYYGINSYPTAVFDGILVYNGGSNNTSLYPTYLPLFNQRQPIVTAFTIDIAANHTGNNYQVQITVVKHAPVTYQRMALIMAVTESDIVYSWQGQSRVHWVERTMAPHQSGTILNFAASDTDVVNLTFTKAANWAFGELEITAFIQDLNSNEILQATKAQLDSLTSAIDEESGMLPVSYRLDQNYPNPFNNLTNISFSTPKSGKVTLEIFDLLGRKVTTLIDDELPAGYHLAAWDASNQSSGVYFFRISTNDFKTTRKMILLK